MVTLYTKHFNLQETPQSEPIPFENQIPNSAGGYGYEISPWTQLNRFLILGTEGGHYYAGEHKMTKENAENAVRCIKDDGVKAVAMITEISTSIRAPKNDPAIFALALVKAFGNAEAKKAMYDAIPKVCRTGTHLFQFCQCIQDLSSWSRGLRNAVGNFYTQVPISKLELQLVKYRQRQGWTHRDVLRLAHPHTSEPERNLLFRYAVGKVTDPQEVGGMVAAYERMESCDVNEAVKLIAEFRLPWECVPTGMTKELKVWEALLPSMGYTAMMRNLAKMTSLGFLKSNLDESVKAVREKLSHPEEAKVHPMAILLALKTYSSGKGFKGSLTWTPIQGIVDTLSDAFYAAFKTVEPTGKNLVLGVDVSGSMFSSMIAGSNLDAGTAAAAMALVTAATEPNHEIKAYSHTLVDLRISPKMRLDSVIKEMQKIQMGGTDCSLPVKWATANKVKVDAFISYTDNETWFDGGCGYLSRQSGHPSQWLRKYREATGNLARHCEIGFTSTSTSIGDTHDPYTMSMAGFDAAVPSLISEFVKGNL